jgi:hypothetical protein
VNVDILERLLQSEPGVYEKRFFVAVKVVFKVPIPMLVDSSQEITFKCVKFTYLILVHLSHTVLNSLSLVKHEIITRFDIFAFILGLAEAKLFIFS